MADAEVKWLAEQAEKAKRIVEIGCLQGRSVTAMCAATEGRVLAIDPFDWEVYRDRPGGIHPMMPGSGGKFLENTVEFRRSGKLTLISAPSQNVNPITIMSILDGQPDFFFIDGNHDTEPCKADIELALLACEEGAVICGHDWGRQTVMDAVKSKFSIWHGRGGSIWEASPRDKQ